jgi:hypothetical protein
MGYPGEYTQRVPSIDPKERDVGSCQRRSGEGTGKEQSEGGTGK